MTSSGGASSSLPAVPDGDLRSYFAQYHHGRPVVLNALHATADAGTHVDRWAPDAGWIDYPPDAAEVHGLEPGTRSIGEATAGHLVAQGVGVPLDQLPHNARVCQPRA